MKTFQTDEQSDIRHYRVGSILKVGDNPVFCSWSTNNPSPPPPLFYFYYFFLLLILAPAEDSNLFPNFFLVPVRGALTQRGKPNLT